MATTSPGMNRSIPSGSLKVLKGVKAMMPAWLYDPSAVEIPNDFFFEATGIVQFPLAVWTAVLTWRLARAVK